MLNTKDYLIFLSGDFQLLKIKIKLSYINMTKNTIIKTIGSSSCNMDPDQEPDPDPIYCTYP